MGSGGLRGPLFHAGELEEEGESQPAAQTGGVGRVGDGVEAGVGVRLSVTVNQSLTGRVMTGHAGGRRWVETRLDLGPTGTGWGLVVTLELVLEMLNSTWVLDEGAGTRPRVRVRGMCWLL